MAGLRLFIGASVGSFRIDYRRSLFRMIIEYSASDII